MELKKWVYIKGPKKEQRLDNLERLADEVCHGNFSEMVNDALNKVWDLDPETGERLCDSNRKKKN